MQLLHYNTLHYINKKWFTALLFLSVVSVYFLLLSFGENKYGYVSISYKNNLIIHKNDKTLENVELESNFNTNKGKWRNLSEPQINGLSVLGRILYLGEELPKINPNRTYTILLWKYGKAIENRHLRHWTSDKWFDPFEKCSVNNCKLTYEDKTLNTSDAVIFHLQRIQSADTLPKGPRNVNQRWIFLTDESPFHTFHSKISDYNGIFNWSMNFRMDADVPVPYGRTITMEEDSVVELFYTDWKIGKRKDVLVAAMISNCNVPSHRLNYIQELQKLITVDVYGHCGKLKCPGHFDNDCALLNQYKFYLAFENSNCPEYITEKLWWNAFSKNAIAVVMGASKAECQQLLPPGSYIHVDDFANPVDLARYILYLNSTPSAFDRYFEWRNYFKILNEHAYYKTDSFHYCRVCEALNYNDKSTKIYTDLQSYWGTDQCRPSWDDYKRNMIIND